VDRSQDISLSQQNFSRRVSDFLAALPFVQRSRTFFQRTEDENAPRLDRAEARYGSVAQPPPAVKPPARAVRGVRLVWLVAPLALLLLLGAGWWLWPRLDAEPALAAAHTNEPAPGALRLLAPTFTPTSSADAAAMAAPTNLMQIVIVTPTPDPSKRLVVAGTVIDRPLAVSGSEGLPGAASNPLGGNLIQAMTFNVAALAPPLVAEELGAEPLPIEVIPLPGVDNPFAPAATATAAPTPMPTPLPLALLPSRSWATFAPAPAEVNDHFWVGQAFIAGDYNQIAAPSYQFGSTAGGRYRPHHGIDVANPSGSPVLAAADGTVVHAGIDDPVLIGPYNNFYGNTVVILLDQKLQVGGGDLDVYLLYGHLSQVNVATGQRVAPGDLVGAVGMTGIAIGPHLHVEMRLGANTYQHSVNPYLWLKPLPGNGAVAVRLLTADGRSWPGQRLTLARFVDGRAVWGRMIETYLDNENILPDPAWGENGAMGDVPAGYYVLVGNVNGESVRAEFFVVEGQTTFVELRTQQ
jgi:murein DD-endopeptidase MepM/ murein hydrolase activator NlpD